MHDSRSPDGAVLVWTRDVDALAVRETEQTRWVRLSDCAVLHTRGLPVVADDHALWALMPERDPAVGRRYFLVDLVSGWSREVLEPGETAATLGVVGPYLLLRACHGSVRQCRFLAVDVRTGAPVRLLSREDVRALVEQLRETAEARLRSQLAGEAFDRPSAEQIEAVLQHEPRHVAMRVTWSRDGILIVLHQLVWPVPDALSDGAWSAGTASVLLPTRSPPNELRPYALAPPQVTRCLPDFPEGRLVGYSIVGHADSATLAAFRQGPRRRVVPSAGMPPGKPLRGSDPHEMEGRSARREGVIAPRP